MHKVADDVQNNIKIPILHVADVTQKKIKAKGLNCLLGTKFTMGRRFLGRLIKKYGLNVLIPDEKDTRIVHDVIYHEIMFGKN